MNKKGLSFTQRTLIALLSVVAISSAFVAASLYWRHIRYSNYIDFIEITLPTRYENERLTARENNCQRTLFRTFSAGRLEICDQTLEDYVRENRDCLNCPKNR